MLVNSTLSSFPLLHADGTIEILSWGFSLHMQFLTQASSALRCQFKGHCLSWLTRHRQGFRCSELSRHCCTDRFACKCFAPSHLLVDQDFLCSAICRASFFNDLFLEWSIAVENQVIPLLNSIFPRWVTGRRQKIDRSEIPRTWLLQNLFPEPRSQRRQTLFSTRYFMELLLLQVFWYCVRLCWERGPPPE